ncbi:MAG: beta-ketoacyl synthase chain length factor [Flavobacteriales bacterium]|nr:beta-ketoacyl synthase chain length factor [Flavobacteriales bacterium]
MKAYIHHAASVSVQPLNAPIQAVEFPADVQHPDYKDRIPPAKIRRMGSAVKMGIWSALEAGAQSEDPIIMGSGLGCLKDSERFLEGLRGAPDIVSPTPFIQSTHNTVSGQIALHLGNHLYNITHTQNGVSFEASLIDAMLWLQEKQGYVMVGGVEEHIPLLHEIADNLNVNSSTRDAYSEGSAFLRVGSKPSDVAISACTIAGSREEAVELVLQSKAELVLTGNSGPVVMAAPSFGPVPTLDYTRFTGIHMSNSAQAAALAFRMLSGESIDHHQPRKVAIFNQYLDASFGVTILEQN